MQADSLPAEPQGRDGLKKHRVKWVFSRTKTPQQPQCFQDLKSGASCNYIHFTYRAPRWLTGEESPVGAGDPWVGKVSWNRQWQLTPGLLPGESHGQRSLVGYSPWGRKRVRHDSVTKQQLHVPPAGEPWHQTPHVHSHLVFIVGVQFSSLSRLVWFWISENTTQSGKENSLRNSLQTLLSPMESKPAGEEMH